MTIRILLTGAPSTGKSTLVELLPHNNDVQIINEVARRILEADEYLMTNRHSLETQRVLLEEQLRAEKLALEKKPKMIIQDRGYLDVISYSAYYGHTLPADWLSGFQKFDYIFLFRLNDVKPSGYYASNEGSVERESLDAIFHDVVKHSLIPNSQLEGSLDKRILKFNQVLIDNFEFDLLGEVGNEGQARTGDKER